MLNDKFIFHYFFSFTVFIFINILIFLNYSKNKYFKIILSLLFVFIISFIVGLRGRNIGIDTKSYTSFFYGLNISIKDKFFQLLATIAKLLSNNHSIFLFLVSFLTNYNYFISFYNMDDKNFCIYFAIFLSFFLFINVNINIIRQGLAMSFFTNGAVIFYKNGSKKCINIIILFLLAILTHNSSIIVITGFMFFSIILYNISPRKTEILFYILIISTFFYSISSLLKPFESLHPLINLAYRYLTWSIKKELSFKYFYILITLMLIFYSFKLKLKYSNKISNDIIKYYLLVLFGIFIIMFFKEEEMFSDRIFYYFFPFLPILIYSLKNLFIEKRIIQYCVFFGINIWFIKSYIIQYIGWFITNQSIRK